MYMIQFVPGTNLDQLTYLTKVDTAWGSYYKIDLLNYAKGLQTAFEGQYIWNNIWPKWPNLPENNGFIVPNMLVYVVKIFVCIQEIIFILPLKLIFYPVTILFQLIGMNFGNDYYTILGNIINLHIPQPSYF